MQALLDFAKGPLFRLTFALMILGLMRILILDIWGAIEAYRKAGDKEIPWKSVIIKTIGWFIPIKRVANRKPFYSLFAILFHIGLILVPILLYAHVQLWKGSLGFGWLTLSKFWADLLTLTTIVFGLAIFLGRLISRDVRFLSRTQDYLWPLILIIPFITGYVCANLNISPLNYQFFMLVHILAGELIFVLIPFTKIAHCILAPFSQFIITLAWKFPARVDDDICATLNKKGAPV
ncbi:MAG: hypothetical protein J7K40_11375 [candidate division Zixibacteria bacterium]|nr:hypothetical protein [candidate division Zixibacteria bacterium]